jgi:hypothetical protein
MRVDNKGTYNISIVGRDGELDRIITGETKQKTYNIR